MRRRGTEVLLACLLLAGLPGVAACGQGGVPGQFVPMRPRTAPSAETLPSVVTAPAGSTVTLHVEDVAGGPPAAVRLTLGRPRAMRQPGTCRLNEHAEWRWMLVFPVRIDVDAQTFYHGFTAPTVQVGGVTTSSYHRCGFQGRYDLQDFPAMATDYVRPGRALADVLLVESPAGVASGGTVTFEGTTFGALERQAVFTF